MSKTGVKKSGKLAYAHGSAVTSGQILVLNSKTVIIAAGAYQANEEGTYYYRDQHKIPKKTSVSFAVGADVFLDTSDSNNAHTSGVYAGVCTKAAATADTTVQLDVNFGYNDTDT